MSKREYALKQKDRNAEWTKLELATLHFLKTQKDWQIKDIAHFLDRPYNGTSNKWKRYDWSKFKDYLNEDEARKLNKEIDPESFITSEIEDEKVAIVERYDTKSYNKLLREKAVKDIIAEKISKAVQALPPLSAKEYKLPKYQHSGSDEEACLVLSDLHCGLVVNADETYGLGSYSMATFQAHCANLTKSVINIIDLHRKAYPVRVLNIFCLGDLIQGMNAAGQWSPVYIETDSVTQIFTCISELNKMFMQFAQNFEAVNIYTAFGNHGRMAHRGAEKEHVNWDHIAYLFMEAALKNQPNIKFFTNRSWLNLAEVKGQKFLLTHGEDIKSWGGIPFYGVSRAEGRYRTLLEQTKNPDEARKLTQPYFEQAIKNPSEDTAMALVRALMLYAKSFDYLVMGHFHLPGTFATNGGGKIIMNGSFFGGDNYSLKCLQSASAPTQKFFGVHPRGLTWQYDLDLTRD
jgi:predicted phosphodiesterase